MLTPPKPAYNFKTASRGCSHHDREQRKVLEDKPVKPVRSIHPKLVKPVRQARGKYETLDNKTIQPQNEAQQSISEKLVSKRVVLVRVARRLIFEGERRKGLFLQSPAQESNNFV